MNWLSSRYNDWDDVHSVNRALENHYVQDFDSSGFWTDACDESAWKENRKWDCC